MPEGITSAFFDFEMTYRNDGLTFVVLVGNIQLVFEEEVTFELPSIFGSPQTAAIHYCEQYIDDEFIIDFLIDEITDQFSSAYNKMVNEWGLCEGLPNSQPVDPDDTLRVNLIPSYTHPDDEHYTQDGHYYHNGRHYAQFNTYWDSTVEDVISIIYSYDAYEVCYYQGYGLNNRENWLLTALGHELFHGIQRNLVMLKTFAQITFSASYMTFSGFRQMTHQNERHII
ncbi:MAG: hypothetical protein K8R90_00575 [Candidatus Cloacimonetes bacterium]|nr:hypothetical protein [Candidatus Cloacimonadota bacterium]